MRLSSDSQPEECIQRVVDWKKFVWSRESGVESELESEVESEVESLEFSLHSKPSKAAANTTL